MSGETNAVLLREKTENLRQDASDAATRRRMASNRDQRAKMAAAAQDALARKQAAAARRRTEIGEDTTTIETAEIGLSEWAGKRDEALSEQDAAQASLDKERRDVFDAEIALRAVQNRGGSKRERSAAFEALQREQREAEEAEQKMQEVAARVANTLKAIDAQINALSKELGQAKSRLAHNQDAGQEGI